MPPTAQFAGFVALAPQLLPESNLTVFGMTRRTRFRTSFTVSQRIVRRLRRFLDLFGVELGLKWLRLGSFFRAHQSKIGFVRKKSVFFGLAAIPSGSIRCGVSSGDVARSSLNRPAAVAAMALPSGEQGRRL